MHSTITDLAGRTIAKLTADRAVLAPSKEAVPSDPIGMLVGASAILYENDTPSLTLVADTLHADRDTRIVVGKGNVTIRSLRQVDSPTIRADTMTWSYNKNLIVGEGHVIVTRQPDIALPGKRFTADTALRHYTLYASAVPATGSF